MIGVALDSPSDSRVPTHGASSVPLVPAFYGNPILLTLIKQFKTEIYSDIAHSETNYVSLQFYTAARYGDDFATRRPQNTMSPWVNFISRRHLCCFFLLDPDIG